MKKIFFVLILIAGTLKLSAQAPNLTNDTKPKPVEKPLDGYYQKTNIISAKVAPYASLRESDVMFSKQVVFVGLEMGAIGGRGLARPPLLRQLELSIQVDQVSRGGA